MISAALRTLRLQIGHNGRQLVLRQDAGLPDILNDDAAKRLGRAVGPELVQRVMRQKDQLAADFRQRLFQPPDLCAGMQPRIDAETEAFLRMTRQPDMRRLVDQIAAGEHGSVHLLGQLRHIATVDENNSL